jgi:low affinity Fe/Cu permease
VGKKTHLLENKIIDAKQYLPIENESTTITQDMITQHVKYYAQKTGELFNPVDKDDIMDVFIKKTEKIHQKIEKDINKILENTRNKYIGLFPI